MLESPLSPETISWDNPFPTFPMKRSKQRGEHNSDVGLAAARGSDDTFFINGQEPRLLVSHSSTTIFPHKEIIAQDQFAHGQTDSHLNIKMHNAQAQSRAPRPRKQLLYSHSNSDHSIQGRHLEDTMSTPRYQHPVGLGASSQRSKTMPNAITSTLHGSRSEMITPRQLKVYSNVSDPMNVNISQNPHIPTTFRNDVGPTANSSQRPAIHLRSHSGEIQPTHNTQRSDMRLYPADHPHSQQDTLGEVLDSYHDPPRHSNLGSNQSDSFPGRHPSDEDLPDFTSLSTKETINRREMTIDDHLLPPQTPQPVASKGSAYQLTGLGDLRTAPQMPTHLPRSKSSPNLKGDKRPGNQQYDDGFEFELPGSVPAMPPLPPQHVSNDFESTYFQDQAGRLPHSTERPESIDHHVTEHNISQNIDARNNYIRTRQRSTKTDRTRPYAGRNTVSDESISNPKDRNAPLAQPKSLHDNPDALPHHPAPVRAGLMRASPVQRPPRPPPVRQYGNGSSPLQETNPSQQPQSFQSVGKEVKPSAVTYEELNRLRLAIRTDPSDDKLQLVLAKRLAEAASVLADENGRVDQRTKNRNRDQFISDAVKLVRKLVQNGHPEATFYLGDCYSRGALGLETNAKEAFSHYQSAAKAGHAQAAYRVAVCCEMGLDEGGGTKRDALKAMQWYQRAATLGTCSEIMFASPILEDPYHSVLRVSPPFMPLTPYFSLELFFANDALKR